MRSVLNRQREFEGELERTSTTEMDGTTREGLMEQELLGKVTRNIGVRIGKQFDIVITIILNNISCHYQRFLHDHMSWYCLVWKRKSSTDPSYS